MKSRRGFTLIELLVVIAIIAILAAILFPVFAKAREKARQATCTSNMKQIGLAIMQYVQDYDETFPTCGPWNYTVNGWMGPLEPYLKSSEVLVCPSYQWKTSGHNYAANGSGANLPWSIYRWWDPTPALTNAPATLAQIVAPANVISSFEEARQLGFTADCNSTWYGGFFGQADGTYRPLHSDGNNFAFCDGHVKWVNCVNHPGWATGSPPGDGETWPEKQISFLVTYNP